MALLAVTIAGTGASCRDTDDASTTTTTAPVSASTTPPSTSQFSSVTTAPKAGMSADEVAIRNLLDIEAAEFIAALDPPDPSRPGVLALNIGSARDLRVKAITLLRDKGEYARRDGGGPVRHKTDSVEVKGDTATATECYVDDTINRKLGTDEVVNATVTSSIQRTSLVRESDGAWRVSDRETLDSGPSRNICPHVG